MPYERWPDVLNATIFGSSCPQFDRISLSVVGNEDCLYLNIYTPSLPALDLAQSKVITHFFEIIYLIFDRKRRLISHINLITCSRSETNPSVFKKVKLISRFDD